MLLSGASHISRCTQHKERNREVKTDSSKVCGYSRWQVTLRDPIWHVSSVAVRQWCGDIPALTPAEAGTRLSDSGRMQG